MARKKFRQQGLKRALPAREGYARYARQYDEQENYWDSFEQERLKEYVDSSDGKTVLDAGAGTGRLSVRLAAAGANVTALDISPHMLALLTKKDARIQAVEGDMEAMPFEDESFDRVFCTLALVHVKEVTPFLEEAYRVLKDGGELILINIHFRKAMLLKDAQGCYTIACYNHFPPHVFKAAQDLAFGVVKNEILTEGDNVWVSQFLVLKK